MFAPWKESYDQPRQHIRKQRHYFVNKDRLKPPTVKRKIKPRAHIIAGDHLILPPWSVANQLKTFTPVGIAIIMVADVK